MIFHILTNLLLLLLVIHNHVLIHERHFDIIQNILNNHVDVQFSNNDYVHDLVHCFVVIFEFFDLMQKFHLMNQLLLIVLKFISFACIFFNQTFALFFTLNHTFFCHIFYKKSLFQYKTNNSI